MNGALVIFSSLPEVGGHATTTLKLCELLAGCFKTVTVLVRDMPAHGRSLSTARELEKLGARVVFLPEGILAALRRARREVFGQPDVFLAVGMRHLSPALAVMLRARRAVYYHITHELTSSMRCQLSAYAAVFHQLVFLSPETWRAWGARSRTAWALQPTEIHGAGPGKPLVKTVGPVRLGFLGRLTAAKGLLVLLDAVACGLPDCELHVAGRGELEGRVRRAGGRVVYHGAYSAGGRLQSLQEFFGRVDVLCVPTLDEREGMPNVILEALQFGVPAVATATGGMRAFQLPELGPAPTDVVRLVKPSDFIPALRGILQSPRLAAPERCREYFDVFFSDTALRPRWESLLFPKA